MSSQYRHGAQEHPHLQVSPAYPTLNSPSSHWPSTQMDGSLQGSESLTERNDARTWIWNEQAGRYQRRMAIGILPDDVLLDIFDFFVVESDWFEVEAENWWCTLVHVCRKWRNIIFESPHRLNLRLVFSDQTPVRDTLDVWPPFPIALCHFSRPLSSGDNIIAALDRNDRVCQIKLKLNPQWEKVLDAMQEPFPALIHLILSSDNELATVVSDSFMGGSAPRLQYLRLERVPIPGLPKILSSATDLVHLNLCRIPHSGYISPEAIVTCISTLPRLKKLYLGFRTLLSRPSRDTRLPPPPTRFVLPALIMLQFTGVSEYLEDLVAQIDCPLLDCLEIVLFHQPIFDTPQLVQFISRTPTLKVYDRARMDFSDSHVRVTFPKTSSTIYHLTVQIKCSKPEWQLSSMAQICTSFFPRSLIQLVERLTIRENSDSKLEWQDNIEGRQWLELLHPFTAVKDLHLSREFAPRIAPSLEVLVGGRTTEVLPALQSIFLEKPYPSGPFEKFVAARELSNHPVAIYQRKFPRKSQNGM